jgi:CRISPR/Cas system-associated protein Cas10 (large subunit of type III CRISPR-Cas system)
MANPTEFQIVVLAPLLHDIGKFIRRTRHVQVRIDHETVPAEFVRQVALTWEKLTDISLLEHIFLHHYDTQDAVNSIVDDIQNHGPLS